MKINIFIAFPLLALFYTGCEDVKEADFKTVYPKKVEALNLQGRYDSARYFIYKENFYTRIKSDENILKCSLDFWGPINKGDTLLLGFTIMKDGKMASIFIPTYGFYYYKNHIVKEEIGDGWYTEIKNDQYLYKDDPHFDQFIEDHKNGLSEEFKEVLEIWNRNKARAKAGAIYN